MALLTLVSDVVNISTDVLQENISFGKRASWNSQAIMNRSSGILTYASSEAMTFTVSFSLYAVSDTSEIAEASRILRGLTTPLDPGTIPPTVCYLTYKAGGFDNWMCVCSSADVSHPTPIYSKSGETFHATFTIALLEVDLDNVPATQFSGTINNLSSRYR